MKNKKTRYKRIKERFIVGASSGIMAGMIFIGSANTVLAEGVDFNTPAYTQSVSKGMHMMRKWNSKAKISALTNNLGLDKSYIDEELKSGKNIKQILSENGVDTTQLDKAFNGKSRHKSWKKHSIGL